MRLIGKLTGAQWKHSIACFRKGEEGVEVPDGVEVLELGSVGRDLGAFVRLSRLIDKLRPGIVHARNWSTWRDTLMACRLSRTQPPLIFSFHGFLSSTGEMSLAKRLVGRELFRRTQCVFTVSSTARELLQHQLNVPAERIGLIPNGVDLDEFHPAVGKTPSHGPIRIGSLGSLTSVKNHRMLLRACGRLAGEGVNFRLRIAGQGPLARELSALGRELGIAEKLELPGRTDRPAEFLRELDIFVLPSRTEAHPNALIEAMACGLPCVGTRVGGIPWVLDQGRAGLLVEDQDDAQLAGALKRLIDDPRLRQELSQAARGEVEERFSHQQMASEYARLYREHARSTAPARPSKPRIVMLGPRYPLTGGMATVTNLLRDSRLADLCDLTVIHNAKTTAEGRSFRAGLSAQIELLGRIAAGVRAGRDKVTHIHTCSGFTFFRDCLHALVARALGSQVVWHVHGARFDRFLSTLPRAGKRLAREMLTRAGGVIVLSKQWIRTLEGFAPDARWRAVPNGVAVPEEATRVQANRCLLFLGNLGKRKGASDLVEALIRARQRCPEVCGKLAGNETAPGELRSLGERISQSPHPQAVELIGIVKGRAKQERLAQAGMFCLPSYAEGLPMAMLEAMAAGLPVIVTRVGAIPEVITDGVEGFLVDPGDVDALSDRIVRLTEDGQLRKTLGAAGRRKVIQHYSLDRMAERIYELYQEVTRRR